MELWKSINAWSRFSRQVVCRVVNVFSTITAMTYTDTLHRLETARGCKQVDRLTSVLYVLFLNGGLSV